MILYFELYISVLKIYYSFFTKKALFGVKTFSLKIGGWYVVGSKTFRPDIQKPRQMENAVRDI